MTEYFLEIIQLMQIVEFIYNTYYNNDIQNVILSIGVQCSVIRNSLSISEEFIYYKLTNIEK